MISPIERPESSRTGRTKSPRVVSSPAGADRRRWRPPARGSEPWALKPSGSHGPGGSDLGSSTVSPSEAEASEPREDRRRQSNQVRVGGGTIPRTGLQVVTGVRCRLARNSASAPRTASSRAMSAWLKSVLNWSVSRDSRRSCCSSMFCGRCCPPTGLRDRKRESQGDDQPDGCGAETAPRVHLAKCAGEPDANVRADHSGT